MDKSKTEAVKLANYARYIKFHEKDEKRANEVLTEAFTHIKCFDDGLFAQSIVKYQFVDRLPEYSEIMYSVAETFYEFTYSLDFFRRCDLARCPEIIQKAEERAEKLEDFLQLCGILDILDKFQAETVFQKAESLAYNFSDYMMIITEGSYFYGWPDFMDQKKVAKVAGKALQLANSAKDYLKLADFCTYYAGILDPSGRQKKLKELMKKISIPKEVESR